MRYLSGLYDRFVLSPTFFVYPFLSCPLHGFKLAGPSVADGVLMVRAWRYRSYRSRTGCSCSPGKNHGPNVHSRLQLGRLSVFTTGVFGLGKPHVSHTHVFTSSLDRCSSANSGVLDTDQRGVISDVRSYCGMLLLPRGIGRIEA